MPSPSSRLLLHLTAQRGEVLRKVARHFPGVCPSAVEDAFSATLVMALERPEPFLSVWTHRGPAGVESFAGLLARRKLRDNLRRGVTRCTVRLAESEDMQDERDPETDARVGELERRLDHYIRVAAARHGGRQRTAVEAALHDRFYDGISDVRIAREHKIRREYLVRARQWVQRELRAA